MLISMILAWLTVIFSILAGLKWIARKFGTKAVNRFFHNIHIPFGILALAVGLLHGILAGNPSFASLAEFTPAPVLFTLNYGSICFLSILLLAVSYLLRKKLRKYWMPAHRVLTILALLLLVLHLVDMGIQLPSRLFADNKPSAAAVTIEPTTVPTAEALPSDSPQSPSAEPSTEPSEVPSQVPSDEAPASTEDSSPAEEPIAEASVIEEPLVEEAIVEEPSAEEAPPLVQFSGAVLADGTYTGSADGFKGTITLTVTVADNQVTDITIDSNSDTPQFFQYALGIVDTIIAEQSLEVDTVSGATFSSAGILNAVYDALTPAVVSGELTITAIDLSSIPRGHRH